MNNVSMWYLAITVIFMMAAAMSPPSQAQTFTTLYNFCSQPNCADGEYPNGLVQATNGDLYGTTTYGGTSSTECVASGCGTVFKITTGGTLTTVLPFDGMDGQEIEAGLFLAANGNLYGTTAGGGLSSNCSYHCGSIYEITPGGTLTTLWYFCTVAGCPDGQGPSAAPIRAANGHLYGTTQGGGANGYGTVFNLPPNGDLQTLYSFGSQSGCVDGEYPAAGLIQASNGDFFGTTQYGGANSNCGFSDGTVFKMTPGGLLTTLYSFCSQANCADGEDPATGLIEASNGDFYGTTQQGGTTGNGTVFRISPSGKLTTLHSFCSQTGCPDGSDPNGLIQATDGNFYGTTQGGGANNYGTAFKMTPGGTLTTLHSFDGTDGMLPFSSLLQATNGDFYGTTSEGGTSTGGTLYRLSAGLGPFVETQTTFGKVAAATTILGTDLTGATRVAFNGTAATFTVASRSEIKTKVPSGATTGFVTVVTPRGTLTSNVVYTVIP